MGRYRKYGRWDIVEETSRLTLEDFWTWGYLQESSYRSGLLTFSRDGEETGSLGIAVNIEGPLSYIKFNYLLGYEKKPVEYEHRIEAFPLHFGGHRYYFKCRYCRRRVTALYMDGGYYACRHCQSLTYRVRREHKSPRLKIRRSRDLKGRANIPQKNRHPRKANRLLERAYQLEGESIEDVVSFMERKGYL